MWHCARDADCRPPERDPIFQMSRRQKAADSHRGRFSPSTKGGRDNLSPAAAAAVALYLYDCIGFSSGGRARLRVFRTYASCKTRNPAAQSQDFAPHIFRPPPPSNRLCFEKNQVRARLMLTSVGLGLNIEATREENMKYSAEGKQRLR